MKSGHFATLILCFYLLLNTGFLYAQDNGCSNITFTAQNLGDCHYRLLVVNSSTCYPEIRLLLDTGEFLSWTAQAQTGWSGELITPTEMLLTHSSGHIPLGASTPIDFYIAPGADPVMTILWDYTCPLGKSCFFEIPLTSCTSIPGGCISGVNYVDVSCAHLPYSNQPTLAGWTIILLDAMGNTVGSTQTDAAGAYSFCDLNPGNYIVKKTNQPGWTPTFPASGQYSINLSQSAQVVRNFGGCRAACLCSSIQTTVQQITTSTTACCYSLSTQVLGGGDYCYQYINVQVDAGLTITPSSVLPGWTMVQNGPQSITITAPNGFVPNGSVTPMTFCVSGGTSHNILAIAGFNDSAGAHECNNSFTFSCLNCDDVSAVLQPISTGDCCFELQINNNVSNIFTGINVSMSSGDFVNAQFGAGWNISLNGSTASLTPTAGGFLPLGSDIPVTICDPGGTNPYTVIVSFVYADDNCNKTLTMDCEPDPCTCQGFQNLEFYNFLNLPNIPVNCGAAVNLPCIGSDATYNFQGNLACSANCTSSIHFEIFQNNGPSVLSGTSPGAYFTTTGFKLPPGVYNIVLTGTCGGNTCTCTTQFVIPACACCSSNSSDFSQTVSNATHIVLDPTNCKASLQIGNLPCQHVDWVNWGDGFIDNGPFTSGQMPMHTYAFSGPHTISYSVQEINPFTGAVCFQAIFTENIELVCEPDCHCGTWSNTSYRFGGAQNQPITCNGTATIPGNAPLAVYTDFICQGTQCVQPIQVFWNIVGPIGSTPMAGAVYPATGTSSYSIFVPSGTFSLPGTYTLVMAGYCGTDSCYCTLNIVSSGICCMDYDHFCDLVNQGFTVQNDGCNVIVTAPQFGICNAIDATLDWGDGTPQVSGTITSGSIWTHSYNNASNQTYNICANVYESTCWTKQMCTPVTITCMEFCEQNIVQNDNFNQGIPNGFDQSINLANHWDGIWPALQSTGDFYNTFSVPYVGTLTPPLPQSQGNFGGFWCAIQPGQWVYREGIMNELSSTLPASSTDVYDLSFKMACLTPINGAPSLSVFGVYTSGLSTGSVPINETTPLNAGLFPPGQAVEIATLPIPVICDENFTTFNFQVNAALFPAQGISHIFFTRTDNTQGDVYLAVDDICLTLRHNSCCASLSDFEQVIHSEVSINVDAGDCSVAFQTGDLPACDAIAAINWGDGNISTGPFAANVTVTHNYAESGMYVINYTANETGNNGQICFVRTFTSSITPICNNACPCPLYTNMVFSPTSNGGSLAFSCGAADIPLPCQPGTNYTISGSYTCPAIGSCSGPAVISWTLSGPQGLVAQSTTIPLPAFSIVLPSGLFSVAGTYTLKLSSSSCATQICECFVYFVVSQPCPPLCPCDVAQFEADVLAGFSAKYYTFSSCKVCFKGKQLGPCDMVEWSIDNGPFSAPISGTQSYCWLFSGNGPHTIRMRVTRKKGLNLICEIFTFEKTITVNCNPVLVDHGGRRNNPGAIVHPIHGFPRIEGPATDWSDVSENLQIEADQNSNTERALTPSRSSGETSIRIFPNPNPGVFSVELSEAATSGMYFRITDITGRVFAGQSTQEGLTVQTIQAGDLPDGMYFLQVVSEGKVLAVSKFVKH